LSLRAFYTYTSDHCPPNGHRHHAAPERGDRDPSCYYTKSPPDWWRWKLKLELRFFQSRSSASSVE
jgi:hypothetical protein